MHIKRFRGKTLEEALKAVKGAFGDDAVVLSTKKVSGIAEVLAAIDFDVEEIEKELGGKHEIKNGLDALRKEMSDLKYLFSLLSRDGAAKNLAGLGSGILELYREMVANGVKEQLSQKIIMKAASSLQNGEDLKGGCRKFIEKSTAVCNPLANGEGPRLLAFIGPTGSGKTTTIAKLAGRLSQEHKAKVGVVSIDGMRLGAHAMLMAYEKTFGVSVSTPMTKEEFNKALWGYKDKDVVFIDTPGRNPRDTEGIKKMAGTLKGGLPIKFGLVLSMTSRDDSIFDTCKGFSLFPIDCLVFTKIDEVQSFGSIINTMELVKKPVAYLCNGQRIPQDIRAASPDKVGSLVLRA